MPVIPAVCSNCGAVFSSGIFVDNVMNLTLKNNTAGPCPVCGGRGRIKDGVYNVINGVINQLKDHHYSKEELLELSKVVNKAKKSISNPERFEEVIEESNPKFSFVLDLLPQNREEKLKFIQFFIPVLLTIIGFFINSSSTSTVEYNTNINQVINMVYEKEIDSSVGSNQTSYRKTIPQVMGKPEKAKIKKNEPRRVQKIGRNQLCPCGSGVKFKKCHGK